ncbi:hypothetical protein COT97_02140 [Candidatus Falkowbacteria bacterium CG10_big_fil_rev_8_21_14_0_10_39_11]|uniref:Uncharacterized protein n=1 Tax=Candidatus Falkowbacteria bacterium CG10_big_fil_rev_8_21_14_0_10_39_11 TaxID=1974565 RepID=A0A2H0V789_9BACT|nr:MAG: hypothetical protein COT97_02140 [Candidatus Falkowbacteria bacterium CG10_big_fil_rev_8_21_14_0_10_39_11]
MLKPSIWVTDDFFGCMPKCRWKGHLSFTRIEANQVRKYLDNLQLCVALKDRGLAHSIARVLGIRCCDIDVLPKHKEWLGQSILVAKQKFEATDQFDLFWVTIYAD